jgi:phosphonate transport system permease protein
MRPDELAIPSRWSPETVRSALISLVVLVLVLGSLGSTGFSVHALTGGLPRVSRLLTEMIPPDFSRGGAILAALGATAQIAIAGTGLGLLTSFPLGLLASRTHSPRRLVAWLFQALLALCRTIPELVWAILFVSCLGPGAVAGVLAIGVDTIGFAGRFYAGAIDDSDPEPREALASLGAGPWLVFLGATLPDAMPSLVHTSLYALERSLRASLVLGIVGAGGIGIELKVAMDLFEYRRAAAIILCIFAVVLAVEALGSVIRARVRPS